MSSKHKHIDTENYEEYLLLYVDGELTTSEMEMVDAFLLLHPGLQMELDMLMSTRLTEEPIRFDGKRELMAEHMKAEAFRNSLLSYIDNELPAKEMAEVETHLSTNENARTELSLLMKTRLDANDQIVYPYKKELYRHSSKVAGMRVWMARAAAVILIASATALYLNSNNGDESAGVVATVSPTLHQKKNPVGLAAKAPAPQDITPAETQPKSDQTLAQNNDTKDVKTERPALSTEIQTSIPSVPENQAIAYTPVEVSVDPIQSRTAEEVAINPKNLATGDVTTPITASYNIQEPGSVASNDDDEKSKGSLKGFLRKATRLIERNTGIGATTDDDRLLIGALAVNLK